MTVKEESFKAALSGKKIPILTLDNKWHKLFTQTEATPAVQSLEKRLTDLVKRQGKLNTESKDIKKIKRKLMDEIIQLADRYGGDRDDMIQKAMERHREMVEECNDRLKALREENGNIPEQIEETNYQLMLRTMELCYKRLEENRKEIEYYEGWIEETRAKLRENMVRKQERETSTYELYTYMHNIFGRDVINIFDMHYHPEKFRPKKKEEGYID